MLHRLLVLAVASAVVASSCTRGEGTPSEPTNAPATTATTVVPTTTQPTGAWDDLPVAMKQGRDWHLGTWESIGYACDGTGEPDVECNVTNPLEYSALAIGNDDGARVTMDYVWLFYKVGASLPGDAIDDPGFLGSGHGVRVEQLNGPPPGLDIGGEAWVRLTISSLSAMDYAETSGKLVPTEVGYTTAPGSTGDAPTPLSESPPPEPGEARWIETVVLVATNDTMSQWIISFNQPGTYAFSATYAAMGNAWLNDLLVGFVPV